jgi:hypothetical protein
LVAHSVIDCSRGAFCGLAPLARQMELPFELRHKGWGAGSDFDLCIQVATKLSIYFRSSRRTWHGRRRKGSSFRQCENVNPANSLMQCFLLRKNYKPRFDFSWQMLREERIITKRMVSQKICPSDGSGERENPLRRTWSTPIHSATPQLHQNPDWWFLKKCTLFVSWVEIFLWGQTDRQTVSGKQISNLPIANCSLAFCKLEEALFLWAWLQQSWRVESRDNSAPLRFWKAENWS